MGLIFFITISTSWTNDAITIIKVTYCKKGSPKRFKIKVFINHTTGAVIVITKVVAKPMPIAESILPDTPRKGHIPKKYLRTKLLIRTAEIKINITSFNF